MIMSSTSAVEVELKILLTQFPTFHKLLIPIWAFVHGSRGISSSGRTSQSSSLLYFALVSFVKLLQVTLCIF